MLLNNFYKVANKVNTDGCFSASVTINANHEIFKGHFPNQPVVPGVCMVQMVKELLEDSIGKKLLLRESSQMKFLLLVVPDEKDVIDIVIEYKKVEDIYPVNVYFKKKETVAFKMNGKFAEKEKP